MIIIGTAAAATTFILAVGLLGFAAIKGVNALSDNVRNLPTQQWEPYPAQAASELEAAGGVFLTASSAWLQKSLGGQEVLALKGGLRCIDSLGGPSPLHVINHLRSRISDQQLTAKLDDVARSFQSYSTVNSSARACSDWILNS